MSPVQTDAATSSVKLDLLSRLGLPEGADEQAVRAAHRSIVEYLDDAPSEIGRWAARRKQEADRLLSLLTGPEAALEPMARKASPAAGPRGTGKVPRPLMVLIGLLVVAGVVFGVYQLGKSPSDLPAMTAAQSTASASPTLDAAQLAALMAKVQANPKDVASLQGIADLYYDAGDFAKAKSFLERILAIDPKNTKALLGAGAASYNTKDYTAAVASWSAAAQYEPNNAEAHYDLGFAYMMTGQKDKMAAEWALVVKLAPDSDMAKNVQQHVTGTNASASPSPAASTTPAPSSTPGK